MNRRQFVYSTAGVTGACAIQPQSATAATTNAPSALMKLGCQSAPTNDTHLKYLARYGVTNICGYPEISSGRLYATVEELKRMRDLAEKNRIVVECVAPPFLASSHIDREKHPAIMLAQSPERDRDKHDERGNPCPGRNPRRNVLRHASPAKPPHKAAPRLTPEFDSSSQWKTRSDAHPAVHES